MQLIERFHITYCVTFFLQMLDEDEDRDGKSLQVKRIRESFHKQQLTLHKDRTAKIDLSAKWDLSCEKMEKRTDSIIQLIGK